MSERAFIFDFDGLMIDSERVLAECVIEDFRSRGVSLDMSEIGHLFGSTEVDEEWEQLLAAKFGDSYPMEELERHLDAVVPTLVNELELRSGVRTLLDASKLQGWKVALATGRQRHSLDVQLDRLELSGRFDVIVTAEEVAQGKPSPDIFLEAAHRLAVTPSRCVALEDSVPGSRAALEAGMTVIVCPSVVTADCSFPSDVRRVSSLLEIALDGFWIRDVGPSRPGPTVSAPRASTRK